MGIASFLISLAAGLTLSAAQKAYSGFEKIIIQKNLDKELSDKAFDKMLSDITSVDELLKQLIIKACKTLSFFDNSVNEIFLKDSIIINDFVEIIKNWLLEDQKTEYKQKLLCLISKYNTTWDNNKNDSFFNLIETFAKENPRVCEYIKEIKITELFTEIKKEFTEAFELISKNIPSVAHHLENLVEDVLIERNKIVLESGINFETMVKHCNNFEEISNIHQSCITSDITDALNLDTFVDSIEKGKAYLIQAPGGSGKSKFALDSLKLMLDKYYIAFYINLAQDPLSDNEGSNKVESYFNKYCRRGSYTDADTVGKTISENKCVVVIDGLNQSIQSWDSIIKEFCIWISQSSSNMSLIIFDRMTNRQVSPLYYLQMYTILPLAKEVIEESISKLTNADPEILQNKNWQTLLSSPFFLNIFINNERNENTTESSTRIGLIEKYLNCHIPEMSNILKLGELAYNIYKDCQATYLPTKHFQNIRNACNIDSDLIDNLKNYGFFVERKETTDSKADVESVEFRHQLFHDGLIALYLTSQECIKWIPELFDRITLSAASYDILELIAEKLGNERDKIALREYLIEMYDWNHVGTRSCIDSLFLRFRNEDDIYKDLHNAIIAVTTEKKFDNFFCTSSRTERQQTAYLIDDSNNPIVASDFGTLAELQQAIESIEFSSIEIKKNGKTFSEWKDLFLLEHLSIKQLEYLYADPITAWTAANVFRRNPQNNTNDYWEKLKEWYTVSWNTSRDSDNAFNFRWRLVHLLGASNRTVDLRFLCDIIFNCEEVKWVRFGAARSLIDVTTRMTRAEDYTSVLRDLVNKYEELLFDKSAAKVRESIFRHIKLSNSVEPDKQWEKNINFFLLKIIEKHNKHNNNEYENWLYSEYLESQITEQ